MRIRLIYWGWAILLALFIGVMPDYMEKLDHEWRRIVCIFQSNVEHNREEMRWYQDHIRWHTDLVIRDGRIVYDARRSCK